MRGGPSLWSCCGAGSECRDPSSEREDHPLMGSSHTKTDASAKLRLVPGFGLLDLADPVLGERLAEVGAEHLVAFAAQMRQGLLAASMAIGLEVLGELMRGECTVKAGPKGRHDSARTALRHGTESGKVRLGGRRVTVEHPRLRAADGTGEVRLETWELATATELLTEHMVAAMLAGVSTRNYATVALEDVGELDTSGVSRSTVSRQFVTATAERLAGLRSRDLSDRRWLVVFADGFDFAGQTMVGALGVTADGTKVPLGVAQGTTENTAVCKTLFGSIRDRGFDASRGVLFVLDGGKGLRKAVLTVFDGEPVVIARCHQHKERNVLDHLPEVEHAWVRRDLRAAWKQPSTPQAKARLEELARTLERINPDAAGSLREGLDETLTIIGLGVTGTLAKTLATTNPMESTVDIVRVHARNVKRWRDGDMRLRWAAAGLVAAERQYRRVKGHQQLPALAQALIDIVAKSTTTTTAA